MILQPRSIRFSPTISRIDTAIQKPEGVNKIDTIFSVHIDGLNAKVSRIYASMLSTPDELFTIENCVDASIAFDGYWQRHIDNKVEFFTLGLPYIAYVTTTNKLYVQQYNGAAYKVTDDDVSNVTIRRGWKALDNSADQGIIIIYNKVSGGVYIRSIINGNISSETKIEEFGNIVNQTITCSITTDYRAAIAVTPENKIALTDRCWSGVSSPQDLISTTSTFGITLKSNKMPTFKRIINNTLTQIDIVSDIPLIVGNYADIAIRVQDSRGVWYSPYQVLVSNDKTISIVCREFSTAVGALSIIYTGTYITNEIGTPIPSFNLTFTPSGTIINNIPIPEVDNINNIKEV